MLTMLILSFPPLNLSLSSLKYFCILDSNTRQYPINTRIFFQDWILSLLYMLILHHFSGSNMSDNFHQAVTCSPLSPHKPKKDKQILSQNCEAAAMACYSLSTLSSTQGVGRTTVKSVGWADRTEGEEQNQEKPSKEIKQCLHNNTSN